MAFFFFFVRNTHKELLVSSQIMSLQFRIDKTWIDRVKEMRERRERESERERDTERERDRPTERQRESEGQGIIQRG